MQRSTKAQADLNRQRLHDEARRQFAARGFHGTSIASIATAVGLTKQSLLHHFGSKERLFSEVLTDLAESFLARIAALEARVADPSKRFEAFLIELLEDDAEEHLQLVMRELLENRERAEAAQRWHLAPYLSALTAMIRATPGRRNVSDADAFALMYLLLGAVSYFKVSQPTLAGMLGARKQASVRRAFRNHLQALFAHAQ
ncbi:MAG: CerR family C-terminal domain-containing protein [Pseudomonadota bacterium]